MVSEVVLWCDQCFHAEEQRHSFGAPELLGTNGVWQEVHLCPECRTALFQQAFTSVMEFFLEYGAEVELVPPKKAPAKAAPATRTSANPDAPRLPCLYCTDDFASPSGIDRHLRVRHGLETPLDFWGNRCPLCGLPFGRLAQHITRSHSLPTPVAFAMAEAQGDPHGVVADQRKTVNA